MDISFDLAKSEKNRQERGLPFEVAALLDWPTAHIWRDERKPYPETRMIALGYIAQRLHVLCFTPTFTGIRVISLRKSNAREVRRYETETAN